MPRLMRIWQHVLPLPVIRFMWFGAIREQTVKQFIILARSIQDLHGATLSILPIRIKARHSRLLPYPENLCMLHGWTIRFSGIALHFINARPMEERPGAQMSFWILIPPSGQVLLVPDH